MPAPPRGACFGIALLVTATATLTTSASAAIVWTVDPFGAGDFTTIQAALDSAAVVFYEPAERPDSILVAPGDYDEVVYNTLSDAPRTVLRAVAGPTMTTLRRFCHAGCPPRETKQIEDGASPGPWGLLVSGFTVRDSLWVGGPSVSLAFEDCRFLDHVRMSFTSNRFFGCEFRGGADFIDSYLAAEDCRFVGSRVFVRVADYWTRFIRCSFEGPVDTAIVHHDWAHTDALRLINCTFRNVGVAVASVRWQGSTGGVWAESCRFEDIGSTAFTWDLEEERYGPGWHRLSPLLVRDSYFFRCQRVLDWGGKRPGLVLLERDTLELCGPSSIRGTLHGGGPVPSVGPQEPHISDLVATGQQGKLFDLALHTGVGIGELPGPNNARLLLERLRVEGGGDTIGVVRTIDWPEFKSIVWLTGSWFDRGSIWTTTDVATVSGNTFVQSGGHALHLALRGPAPRASVHHNTILGSLGDGLRISAGTSFVADIHHNLLVQNAGDGLHIGAPYVGSIASNDSWLNYGAAYFGGGSLDSNLTADPIFCDVAAGNLTVSSVSPCRPTGPYGQIGAHGEGCARLADAVTHVEGAGARVSPNPARGEVIFSLPGHSGGWRAEVFDVAGRKVWGSAPDSQGPIRWSGLTDSGAKVGAGLYWVRFCSGGLPDRVLRLAWLE